MNPGWLLKTRSPSSFIRRNASRASSELRSMFHLPMVQRRYVTTPPGVLLCYGHHDNDLVREAHLPRWRILAKAHIETTLFTRLPGKNCPRRGTSYAQTVNVASMRRAKWMGTPSLAARRATLQAPPRLFGQFQKRCSPKF